LEHPGQVTRCLAPTANLCRPERRGVETAQIRNLLLNLYLHLKAGDFKDLARLVDVLSLHGFLPSFDAR
jgi:hypothetical protein